MWGLAPGGAPGGNILAEVRAPLGPISAYASPPANPGRPVDHCLFPLDRVRPGSLPGTLIGHCLILGVGWAGRTHGALGGERLWHSGGIWGAVRTWERWPWNLPAHAHLPPSQMKTCVCSNAQCPGRRSAAGWASSRSSSPWAATVSSSSSPHPAVRVPSAPWLTGCPELGSLGSQHGWGAPGAGVNQNQVI